MSLVPRLPDSCYIGGNFAEEGNAMGVMRLGFVQTRETDLDKATDYYTNVLGLQEVARKDGKRYFKCWDEYDHHSVVIENGGLGLVKMGYKVETQDELGRLEKAIEAFG